MPGEDGYSLIQRVRGGEGNDPTLPAAALTAHMRDEDRERAIAAGFQMHIPKSVEAAELVRKVTTLTRGKRGPILPGQDPEFQ